MDGSSPIVPAHFNCSGCCVKDADGKGRGVFATRTIPSQTIIDTSPVLLFTKEEYELHGKYTILDHYTFKWRDGRMALALGLGSLFNHSESPNVSYTIDASTDSIRFQTTKELNCDEELCIFYGHNLWFVAEGNRVDSKDKEEIIPENDLPFTRIRTVPEEEEEELGAIRTVQAWVVDIGDSRQITSMLKWLKSNGLESPNLAHLKRIRKQGNTSTLLLSTSTDPPHMPDNLILSEPYTVSVPRTVAQTWNSLRLKSSLWPTVFAPRRKGELEPWSMGKVRWARDAMQTLLEGAQKAVAQGDLPIIAYVPPPYEQQDQLPVRFIASDTRRSAAHPLRHAVMNVVRQIADYRATKAPTIPVAESSSSTQKGNEDTRNGTNYLLTSLTLFTTHEPCVMCSMALIHSRVKELFFLIPMEKTGGCGSLTCVSRLEGLNHRFTICRWREGEFPVDRLAIDLATDA